MRLTVFNGSPRGRKSNTRLLLERFTTGYLAAGGCTVEVHYLKLTSQAEAQRRAFAEAEAVILAFPLYVHAMPGQVKAFVEGLVPRDQAQAVPFASIVQQGFPETHQSAWLLPWLARLPRRLGCTPAGIFVKGGVEGIQIMPPLMTRRLYGAFEKLGRGFARQGRLDESLCRSLAEPVRLSPARLLLLRGLKLTGVSNFYWNSNLKKHGAMSRRDDRPYAP